MEEPKTLSASIRRSPLRAAAVLLCIYVAMYLAVGGALYMVRGPEASAATQPHSAVAAIAWDVCS